MTTRRFTQSPVFHAWLVVVSLGAVVALLGLGFVLWLQTAYTPALVLS